MVMEFDRFGTIARVCPHCKSPLLMPTRLWPEKHGTVSLVMGETARQCTRCGWRGPKVSGCMGTLGESKYKRRVLPN